MPKSHYSLVLSALLMAPLTVAGCDSGAAEDAIVPGEQTTDEQSDLLQLREEEKLARDVYLTLHDEWGTPIFEMISGSEQRHMDAVGGLLDAYQIADPITDDSVGVFQNSVLASLYDELVAKGRQSEVDALAVGATIEDLDIFDIRAMRENTENSMVIDVYDSLECGSSNHLRAFTSQLSALNADYEPQYLSATDTQAILAADHESCGDGAGQGNGSGNGNGAGGNN